MMYLYTPEQHKQVQDALRQCRAVISNAISNLQDVGSNNPYFSSEVDATIAMLKAMRPVSPAGWWDTIDGGDFTYSIGELMGGNTDGLLALYTPTKD